MGNVFHKFEELDGREVFLDTNVLIFMYAPEGTSYKIEYYAGIFDKLFSNGSKMITSFIVISEFINRIMRIEFDKYKRIQDLPTLKYKDFRKSEAGAKASEDAYGTADAILYSVEINDNKYSSEELIDILSKRTLDCNDAYICQLCKDNNYILFTDDKDFRKRKLDVLTMH